MKKLINIGSAALLVISMSGCIVVGDWDKDNHDDWRSVQQDNRQMISQLELGTSRNQVTTLMGAPSLSEAFSQDGVDYRILYYRTQKRHSDGETTKDETTPLVFKNDKLIGWGEETLNRIR